MENVSHKNNYNRNTVQVHVDPHPITLIKSNNDDNSEKCYVKIKFLRDPMSEKSDPYKFKMTLFDNGETE